jgi:hypothetical protein
MAPALRMTRSIKEKLPIFLGFLFHFLRVFTLTILSYYSKTLGLLLPFVDRSSFALAFLFLALNTFFSLDIRVISLTNHIPITLSIFHQAASRSSLSSYLFYLDSYIHIDKSMKYKSYQL